LEKSRKALEELKENLADLEDTEKEEKLKDARREVARTIKEIATVGVEVSVSDGKASPVIDTESLVEFAKAVKAAADELNGVLESAGGSGAKVELTLELGMEEADEVEVALPGTLLEQLADIGIDYVSIAVGGVAITFSPADVPDDAVLRITKREQDDSSPVPEGSAASAVYEIEFSSGGESVTAWASPVKLGLPVDNPAPFDPELLTLAKIDGGRLIILPGKYDPDTGSVWGWRDSFSAYVVVENKAEFHDLAPVHKWAGRHIQVAAAKGIIVGDGKGSFRPMDHVTRAEFVKMLMATFGITGSGAAESFSDVSDGDWFRPYVAAAVQAGIAEGRTADRFAPNDPITRQEMAYMTGRALRLFLDAPEVANVNAVLGIFADAAEIDARYKSDVAITVNEKVMIGSDGRLNPLGYATRAEAAVVIKRLIDLM